MSTINKIIVTSLAILLICISNIYGLPPQKRTGS